MSKLLSYTVSSCSTAVRGMIAAAGNTRFKKWQLVAPLAALALALACSESTQHPLAPTSGSNMTPSFAQFVAGNGPGQCLLEDTQDAGFLNNITSLNCTSNDVDISFAEITQYSVNGSPFVPLDSGQRISCVPGDVIRAVTDALLQNNAQERYDLGLWINATPGGSALTGPSPECTHYNLVNGAANVVEIDATPDQCGDVAAGVLVTVPLDTLTLTCPGGGATSVTVDACAAWSNGTTGANDRICPVNPPGGSVGFRYGTTPGTTAKCRCEPLDLPIDVKGVLRIHKETIPDGSATSFTFTPNYNSGTTFNLTDGQTNNSPPLSAGTYTAVETVPSGWSITSRSCVLTGTATAKTFTTIANGVSVDLAGGEDVTCTFENTQAPKLTVNKVCVPTSDTGLFNLRIDGSTAGTGADAACGGTTGAVTVSIGSHTASETAGTGNNLSHYNTVISGDCNSSGVVSLAAGDNKTCTITNTRKPTLTVNKVCVPTSDTGKFNLRIDGSTAGTGADAACGGTTGAVEVTIGSHTASETAGTGTSLGDYASLIGGDCATNGTVSLAAGENKTCTITNTKKATLTVNKVCVPTSDTGKFNLQIDAATAGTGADAACGGTTGAVTVTATTHTVGETQGTGTLLSNYTTVISGDCAANGTVTLAAGDNKTCTITNTRKPTLTVNKVCVPTSDTGHFNLQIDAATAGTGANAACGGTTGAVISTIGSHTAGETAGTATTLGNYNTVISGDCAANGTVTLAAGDNKTCTITNTRKPGLTVNKVCVPSTDTGHFNLQIDAATAGTGANAACGGTTGAVEVTIGSHTAGETAGTGTVLSNYITVISGDCAANGTVTLAAGDSKTCTITNTRKPHLTVNKVCVPTTDPGHFNLQIDAANAGTGADAACGGTTGSVESTIGGHTVGETAGTNTDLANYVTVISGDCAANGTVTLAAGDNKTCTITNSRKAVLIVDKVTVGGGTQSFEFSQTGTSNFFLADATTPHKSTGLLPGNFTVCELALAVAWNAAFTVNGSPVTPTLNGTTGDACYIVALAYGDSTTVVVTNTPPPGGATRTIGYWKNWSSCAQSNGKQYEKAIAKGTPEATLDFYLGGAGVVSIYPIGTITSLTCLQAVNLLSKNAINGDKRAGDPIYSMVAQLLGAKLNVAAGAGSCPALDAALADAQALLLAITPPFDGTGSYKGTLTPTQLATANSLNAILTSYNEGTLGGGCPTHI